MILGGSQSSGTSFGGSSGIAPRAHQDSGSRGRRRTGLDKSASIVSVLSAIWFELPVGSISGPMSSPGGCTIVGLSAGPWEDVPRTPSGTICMNYSPSSPAGIAQQRM